MCPVVRKRLRAAQAAPIEKLMLDEVLCQRSDEFVDALHTLLRAVENKSEQRAGKNARRAERQATCSRKERMVLRRRSQPNQRHHEFLTS